MLSARGGLLTKLALPIKFMAGSAFGSGRQWQSWIHISDLPNLFLHCAMNNWKGLFNAVSPNPVLQRELIKEIGKALNRPVFTKYSFFYFKDFWVNVPSWSWPVMKISAKLILKKGFSFQFSGLDNALRDIYNKKR